MGIAKRKRLILRLGRNSERFRATPLENEQMNRIVSRFVHRACGWVVDRFMGRFFLFLRAFLPLDGDPILILPPSQPPT